MIRNTAIAGVGFSVGVFVSVVWQGRQESSQIHPHIHPEGAPKSMKTGALEAGAKLFQSKGPLQGFNIYLVGFHPMVEDPCHQMEAHHYCKQVNEDFAQCILFDGNTRNCNVTGIEYIISERLFQELPPEERHYWHPHNYEILSGMLTAPGIPKAAERELMKTKINSYGKTIHTWRAKCWEGNKPYLDTLPKGNPLLGWSFNHDGEVREDMIIAHDIAFNSNIDDKRNQRQGLTSLAHPQEGVDKLFEKFQNKESLTCLKGVIDESEVKPSSK